MFALRRSMTLVFVLLIALMPGLAAWPSASVPATALAATARVAYIYKADTVSRDSFKTMLELRGSRSIWFTLAATVANHRLQRRPGDHHRRRHIWPERMGRAAARDI